MRTPAGHLLQKADPYARRFEVPPNSASVIWTGGAYQWRDSDWMRDRESSGAWHDRPMSTYEVHLGSWRRVPGEGHRYLTYRELADTLVPYVREMGYTHMELLPVMDDLERFLDARNGLDAGNETKDYAAMVEGARLIYQNVLKILQNRGVTAMETVGHEFDPNRHEAMMQMAVEGKAPNLVVQENAKGYLLYDKVLRPAKVIVSA